MTENSVESEDDFEEPTEYTDGPPEPKDGLQDDLDDADEDD